MERDGPTQVLSGDAAAPRQRDAWAQSHVLKDPGPRAEPPHHLGRGLKSVVREGWGLRERLTAQHPLLDSHAQVGEGLGVSPPPDTWFLQHTGDTAAMTPAQILCPHPGAHPPDCHSPGQTGQRGWPWTCEEKRKVKEVGTRAQEKTGTRREGMGLSCTWRGAGAMLAEARKQAA